MFFQEWGCVFMGLSILLPCPFYKVLVQPPIESKVPGHKTSIHFLVDGRGKRKSFSDRFGPSTILTKCKNISSTLSEKRK